MSVTIRPAGAPDIPAMCGLLDELFRLEGEFAPDPVRQVRGLSSLVTGPAGQSCVLVAEHAGAVVGMVSVQMLISTAEGGPVGMIEDVIVRKDRRRRGIGSRLLDAAEAWGRSHGLRRLQLLAVRENAPALRFYESSGFLLTGMVCLRKRL